MKEETISYPKIEEASRNAFRDTPPTHDFSHTKRVLNLCMRIGKEEGGELEILEAAALLHDIARDEADFNGECHAELSAVKARPILRDAGFPPETIEAILHCIETHRFRGDNPPKTIEAKILYDADKLDAIGAIGVCRAYAYCGENGQKLYGAFSGNILEEGNEEKLSKFTDHTQHNPVIEFRLKLSKIKKRPFTGTTKAIAESRHRYMLKFFNRLYEEVKGIK